jgi:formamidopyrimidine-DNA glycosylase
MPELPEVEITTRGVEPFMRGQTITSLIVRVPKLRWPIDKDLDQKLKGATIKSVDRRAKYILINCTTSWLIVHLGMSGSLRVIRRKPSEPEKHDHFDMRLENGTIIRYRDPRKFGAIIWTSSHPSEHPLLRRLGPEPFDTTFDGNLLYRTTRNKHSAIKSHIMNHHVVTGVGNIYANEALFYAGIRPTKKSSTLSKNKLAVLSVCIRNILARAIDAGGSSLKDFYRTDGSTGYFQNEYMVYGRNDEPCRVCTRPIKVTIVGQRSTFYCPNCQK